MMSTVSELNIQNFGWIQNIVRITKNWCHLLNDTRIMLSEQGEYHRVISQNWVWLANHTDLYSRHVILFEFFRSRWYRRLPRWHPRLPRRWNLHLLGSLLHRFGDIFLRTYFAFPFESFQFGLSYLTSLGLIFFPSTIQLLQYEWHYPTSSDLPYLNAECLVFPKYSTAWYLTMNVRFPFFTFKCVLLPYPPL